MEEFNSIITMVAVVSGAFITLFEFMTQRDSRSKRQFLELKKVRLEIAKLQKELGVIDESITPEHNSEVSIEEKGVDSQEDVRLLSPIKRIGYKILAASFSIFGVLLAIFAVAPAPDGTDYTQVNILSYILSGTMLAITAKLVLSLKSDAVRRVTQRKKSANGFGVG